MRSEVDPDLLKVAWVHAQYPQMTQAELARIADVGSQAQVSRLLNLAREKGILREVFTFPADTSDEVRRIVEQSLFPRHNELEAALVERSGELADRRDRAATLKRLHVVPVPRDMPADKALDAFGRGASEIVFDYVDGTHSCMSAWGRAVGATVKFLREGDSGGRPKAFMPVAGEPQNHSPNGVSPSDAASIMAQRWRVPDQALSLRGVQARIPRSVATLDSDGIARKLVAFSQHYKKIFVGDAGERPLIENVGMILTGIGDVSTSKDDPWFRETSEAEDNEENRVLDLTLGNIGGVWLPRPDLEDDAKARAEVDQMNERWLGAQLKHFLRCARHADLNRGRPGVVVLAVEPTKSKIILAALDLINVLIVSYSLAEQLAAELLGPVTPE